jgi:hypothetical protein
LEGFRQVAALLFHDSKLAGKPLTDPDQFTQV